MKREDSAMPINADLEDASSGHTKSTSRADEFVANVLRNGQVVGHLGRLILQWQLTTVRTQWQAKRDGLFHGNPSVIIFDGDFQLLASCLGYTSSAAGFEVEQFIKSQAFSEWKFADGSRGNMIILNERPRSRGMAARITIVLGSMLMPEFVHDELLCGRARKTRTEWWT